MVKALRRKHNIEMGYNPRFWFMVQFSPNTEYERWGIGLALFGAFVFFSLPIKAPWRKEWLTDEPCYGVNINAESIFVYLGMKSKVIEHPWVFKHYREWAWYEYTEITKVKGTWLLVPSWTLTKKLATKYEYPYSYTRKNGEVQNVTATVSVSKTEYRRRGLRWLPFFAKVERFIWAEFNAEIGESVDDWKGGALGCGYMMLPGETPEQTLRRMEKVRKF